MKPFGVLLLSAVGVFVSIGEASPTYIDNNLMTWTRGSCGTTWQEWTFDNADNPAAPENSFNPYGSPTAAFNGTDGASYGSVDFGWKADWDERTGVWAANTLHADFYIPNNPAANSHKIIWFEMEYQAVSILEKPTVVLSSNYQIERIYYDSGTITDDWRTMVVGWKIWPNPVDENITFTLWGTGGFVNSVSIDTICVVPAPPALPLTGLGMLLIRVLKKRKSL